MAVTDLERDATTQASAAVESSAAAAAGAPDLLETARMFAPEGADPAAIAAAAAAAGRLTSGSGAGDASTDGYFSALKAARPDVEGDAEGGGGFDGNMGGADKILNNKDPKNVARRDTFSRGSAAAAERIRALQVRLLGCGGSCLHFARPAGGGARRVCVRMCVLLRRRSVR